MRQGGKIVKWDGAKGFGFIRPDDGTADVFSHIQAFHPAPSAPPEVGLRVKYSLKLDAQIRLQAVKIRPEAQPFFQTPALRIAGPAAPLLLLAGALVVLFAVGKISVAVCLAALFINGLTYAAYVQDKSSAKTGRWRTKEGHLHLVSLLGGWPAAFLAQHQLRHKNRKTSFQIAYAVTVVLNTCAAGFYFIL